MTEPRLGLATGERGDVTVTEAGTAPTYLSQLHQLFGGRHDVLWLHLVDEAVGDAGVSIMEQLADDEAVQVLSVLQGRLWTVHAGQLLQPS